MDDIVILAGGECPADLATVAGVPRRADIPYNDSTFLQIAIDAVTHLGHPLIVGGNPDLHPRTAPGGATFVESLENALDNTKADRFLLVFADLPFLTQTAVTRFIQLSDPQADVNYPIIPADLCKKAFPSLPRTTVTIKEGQFTGGNLALLNTASVRKSLPLLKQLYEARKSPFKIASLLGLKTLFLLVKAKFAPHTVEKAAFEKALSQVLELKVKGVVTPEPGIGTDIDNAEQYRTLLTLQKTESDPKT